MVTTRLQGTTVVAHHTNRPNQTPTNSLNKRKVKFGKQRPSNQSLRTNFSNCSRSTQLKKKSVKKTQTKAVFKCTHNENGKLCGQTYSKSSNLQNHIQTIHKGLCWICPQCQENQVSLHSHTRHMQNIHGVIISKEEAKQNQFYLKGKIRQTEQAKDAHIKALMNTVLLQQQEISILRAQLSRAKQILLENSIPIEEIDKESLEDNIDELQQTEQKFEDEQANEDDEYEEKVNEEEEEEEAETEEEIELKGGKNQLSVVGMDLDMNYSDDSEGELTRGPVFKRMQEWQNQYDNFLNEKKKQTVCNMDGFSVKQRHDQN